MDVDQVIRPSFGLFVTLRRSSRDLRKYWNLLASVAYLLASFTILLAMCEASRLIHHTGWPSYVYAVAFALLVVGTQLTSALAGKLISSS